MSKWFHRSTHPLNLGIRFLLEIAALISMAIWGIGAGTGFKGILMAIVLILGFAMIWGIFAVKDDPSRSGKAIVSVPGWSRLFLELILFGISVTALYFAGHILAAVAFLVILILHYLFSWDRIMWLMKQS